MIDRLTIERIKDAADIVDVVSEFVSLKKVGANYRGLCPFHNDHTPSFYVSPARRTCHCFVCGEGGDSVGFVMRHEQLTYPDALRWLARRYHIEIQEKELTEEQKKEQTERESMFIVNQWAAEHFADILQNDIDGRAIGMQYFRQRGIRDDIINKFQLGFSLSDREALAKAALAKGYKGEYLVKTGLCYARDGHPDELIDRFAGRVIFPWIGVSGKVVGFGGRVLDARTKGAPVPNQTLQDVIGTWPKGDIPARIGDYMFRPHQRWTVAPVSEAGGYLGGPYFKITIEGTDRALAATSALEVTTVPAFTGADEQLWRIEQLIDGTFRIMPKTIPGQEGLNKHYVLYSAGDSTPTLAPYDFSSDNSKWNFRNH